MATDASGDTGWGITTGSTWLQGLWDEADKPKSINYKELKVYLIALQRLQTLLSGKLLYLKLDNTRAVHYINSGSGRIGELADLAKSIRLAEVELDIESYAVHLPGDKNVTADGLSRLQLHAKARDAHPLSGCSARSCRAS